jgi:manganese/zinc/iron transport system substrate-binding protein
MMYGYISSLLLSLTLLVGCSGDQQANQGEFSRWMQSKGKLRVLSTTAMINDIVQQVGGDTVTTLTLIRGELDPHSYQLVKGDDEKLQTADLIFSNGLGLEHGPSLSRFLLESSKAIPLGDRIAHANPEVIIVHDGQLDPHIWTDISLWSQTIPVIVAALSERDPKHAEMYRTNGDRLQKQMRDAHASVRAQLQRIPSDRRYLITSHDAFNYFTRAYLAADHENEYASWSVRFAAPEGLAPDSQLSSTDIQKILDHVQFVNVHVIFPESNVSRDSKIVQAGKENGLDLVIADTPLYGDAMGKPGSDGDTYVKMIQHNANTLEKYLQMRVHE